MRPLELTSRAWATVWTPEVAEMLTQKRVALSTTGADRPFWRMEYWPSVLVMSRPARPPCAACGVTDTKPVPGREVQALVSPDSKPSANTTSVGPDQVGVSVALAGELGPRPAAFSAATVNV